MNIADIRDCYGCGVCTTVCARQIIDLRLNANGFYMPYITDKSKCTDCGLCTDICSYVNDGLSLKNDCIRSYAAWSNDDKVRQKCSSGGIGFEIGRILINQGYKVCGVRYNIGKKQAEHYIATTVEELIPSMGSKYIQSYTVEAFKAIRRNEKYLVTGTPCQIDSFRRYIQKFRCDDNFILLDFFCHGIPSMLMWKKYITWAEKLVGRLQYVSWRNKFTGWHDSWGMSIVGDNIGGKVDRNDSYDLLMKEKETFLCSRLSQGDMFYRLFLSDSCLGKACYEKCKFKYANSAADIRIGDLWGNTYKNNEKGVSAVAVFTEKGEELLRQSKTNCTFVEHPFEVVADGQMKTCPNVPPFSKNIWNLLKKENVSISQVVSVIDKYERMERWKKRVNRLLLMFGIKFKIG